MKRMNLPTPGAFETLEQPDGKETDSANVITATKAVLLQTETVPWEGKAADRGGWFGPVFLRVSYLCCWKQPRVQCSTCRPEPAGTQITEPSHNPTSELSKDCLKSRIIQQPKQQVVLWSFRITHLIFLRNEIEQPQRPLQRKITKFISWDVIITGLISLATK